MTAKPRDRRELGFFEHLDELRGRILRGLIYVIAGTTAGWVYRVPLLALLRAPAEAGARQVGVEDLPFRVFEPVGGFMIAIQVSLLAGVIAAAPLLLMEIWGFVEPALEDRERRWAVLVLPFGILLFFSGVAFCYVVSPNAFAFLFRIDQSLGVEIERTLQPYLWFMMRLMLGFGLAFELPLVLMFLGFIGVVTSRRLLAWWRQATVIIFVFAAIVTPTVDPVNMTILAVPLMVLYMISIGLVALVQRGRKPAEEPPEAEADIPPSPDEETADTYAVYEEAERSRHEAEAAYTEGEYEPVEGEHPDFPEVPPPSRDRDDDPTLDP